MYRKITTKPSVWCLLALFGNTAMASSEITLNGFLNVGAGIANPKDDDEYVFNYEDDLTYTNDTQLGLQITSPLTERLTAVGQLVARGRDGYELDATWAYISYAISDEAKIRGGRFRTPFYLYSDYLEVGYAYHWIGAPEDVYTLPSDSLNGVDLIYQFPLGSSDLQMQLYNGSSDAPFESTEAIVKIRDQTGLALTWTYDWLTLRASYHQAEKVTFENFEVLELPQPLGSFGNLAAILNSLPVTLVGTSAQEAAKGLSADENTFTFSEVAMKIEWNKLLIVAEYASLDSDGGPVGKTRHYYGGAGYTFGDFLVHVTQVKTNDEVVDLTSNIPVVPGITDGLIVALDSITSSFVDPDRTENIIGVRWDLEPGVALKAQYSEVNDDVGTEGSVLKLAINVVF